MYKMDKYIIFIVLNYNTFNKYINNKLLNIL